VKWVLAVTGLLAASASAATDWYKLTPDEFAHRPEAQARIDSERFDRALLGAAIFQETNRVRRQLGLKPFTHLAKLDDAADLKASVGILEAEVRHTSDLPFTATPADRVKAVGLDYAHVAENIARLSSYDLPDGATSLGIRQRNGADEFYRLDTGQLAELQAYADFAAAVVRSWMKSPAHHANIVDPDLVSLGCAARPCRSPIVRHEQIYAVQVFFTPRE